MLITPVRFLLLTLVLYGYALVSLAQTSLIPAPPQVSATSYILMDADSGAIIVEHNAHEPLPPASLTKMMTSYIAEYEIQQGNVSLSEEVPVSVNAWKTGGSKMFIREGTQVPMEDLLKGIIIQSGNDASVAVAEYLAGSEDAFADIMNQHARILGMKNSHFVNSTGLPSPDHYASASDLALLAKAIIRQFPEHYSLYSEKYFTYNGIRQPNRNRLLWRDKSVDGLKTGHTEEAGFCLVASAKRDGMRLISVVMGTNSEEARARETQKLMNYGFRYYETHKLYSAQESLHQSEVWKGQTDSVKLGLQAPLTITVPRGQKENLEAVLDVDKIIEAPVTSGKSYGEFKLMLNGEIVSRQPLVALEPVEEAGFFKRLWHAIVLFFLGLFE